MGGDDYDEAVIRWLASDFRRDHGIDLRQDQMALQRLKESAEKAKCELSSSASTEINLPFITADASGPKHLTATLTRAKLEELVEDLSQRTTKPCDSYLKYLLFVAFFPHLVAGPIIRPRDLIPQFER